MMQEEEQEGGGDQRRLQGRQDAEGAMAYSCNPDG